MSPTPQGPDPFTQWDAAYVLGALSPTDRSDYEEHLSGCAECRAALAELAGMPAMLDKVPAAEVLAMDLPEGGLAGEPPAPPAASVTPLRRAGRRRWATPLAAAAAALVIGGAGGYAISRAGEQPADQRLAFSAVQDAQPVAMTAVVDLVEGAQGTTVQVECQYATEGGAAYADYSIWVVSDSGDAQEIRTWTAKPDKVMHPSGVTSLPVDRIGAVEIRRVDTGATVLRADA